MNIWTKRNKLNQIAIKKQMEFPELTCVKDVYNPADHETVLVEKGSTVAINKTEIKDADGKKMFIVTSKEAGFLFMTEQEIRECFDCSGVKLNEAPYRSMGFKIDESNFAEQGKE